MFFKVMKPTAKQLLGTSKKSGYARVNQRNPLWHLEWMKPKTTPWPILQGALLAASAILLSAGDARAILVDFEGLNSMTFYNGNPVPSSARLSTQLLETFGVRFASTDPYVAVVRLGSGHATSGINGIGGSSNNTLSYNDPITISFFDPLNPSQMATTDSVSVRADLWGGGPSISLEAYDQFGAQLAAMTVPDNAGPLLSITAPGIQKVVFLPTSCCGLAGLDDLTFGPLNPVTRSAPGPLPMLGVVAAYYHSKRLRQRISARDRIR
jgi:hypothetical protein